MKRNLLMQLDLVLKGLDQSFLDTGGEMISQEATMMEDWPGHSQKLEPQKFLRPLIAIQLTVFCQFPKWLGIPVAEIQKGHSWTRWLRCTWIGLVNLIFGQSRRPSWKPSKLIDLKRIVQELRNWDRENFEAFEGLNIGTSTWHALEHGDYSSRWRGGVEVWTRWM